MRGSEIPDGGGLHFSSMEVISLAIYGKKSHISGIGLGFFQCGRSFQLRLSSARFFGKRKGDYEMTNPAKHPHTDAITKHLILWCPLLILLFVAGGCATASLTPESLARRYGDADELYYRKVAAIAIEREPENNELISGFLDLLVAGTEKKVWEIDLVLARAPELVRTRSGQTPSVTLDIDKDKKSDLVPADAPGYGETRRLHSRLLFEMEDLGSRRQIWDRAAKTEEAKFAWKKRNAMLNRLISDIEAYKQRAEH
jgi:hypothetical protein